MIINYDSVNFEDIKNNLNEYISKLDNYKEIKEKLSKSTMDLLISLIAGYTSYNVYKNKLLREETYLQKAKLDTSIFEIGKTLGYRFMRAKAPEITIKYLGNEDLFLKEGDIIGNIKINNKIYDIFYFDYPRKLKYNDLVNFKIGFYKELEYIVGAEKFNTVNLIPENGRSIDNNNIRLYADGYFKTNSIVFEDFLLNNKMINWSNTNTEAIIYISDKTNNYGDCSVEKLNIKYVETDGQVETIDHKNIKFSKPDFYFYDIYFYGLNEDDINKIKNYAPILRNTKGRAVTLNDYKYYIMNTNLLEDVYLEPEQSVPATWKIDFDDFLETFTILIEGSLITLKRNLGEDNNSFKERIYTALIDNLLITPSIINLPDGNKDLILEQKYLEREINISSTDDNIKIEVINNYLRAQSCVLNVYYVKKGNKTIRDNLTTSELLYLDSYIKNYAIVGIKVAYIPSIPKLTALSLGIKLIDNKFQEEVYNYIKEILKEYEYKLNTNFEVNRIISQLTKYKTWDNGIEIYPVQYVKNTGDEEVINSQKYEYLVFYGLDIVFE